VLKVEAIGQLYARCKIFFYQQIFENSVTQRILEFLHGRYKKFTAPVEFLNKQLRILNGVNKR